MDVKTLAPQFRGIPALDIDRRIADIRGQEEVQLSAQQKLERRIVWNLLRHLQANGWGCKVVFDGDCSYYRRDPERDIIEEDYDDNRWESDGITLTPKQVMEIVFNLDEASVRFAKHGAPELHGVYLVLGNGVDCIADWNYDEDDADGFNAAMEAFNTEVYE